MKIIVKMDKTRTAKFRYQSLVQSYEI